MKVMGLFSGIGGFELAVTRLGAECVGLCDIDDAARAVLTKRFAGVPVYRDVAEVVSTNGADMLVAGFPCQDLSQAGGKLGIRGRRSRLVDHIFRIIERSPQRPEWVLLENVSYMLKLQRGQAMEYILHRAEELGYNWAYRVLDARCFGLPQRRERVVILMSRSHDPSMCLFPDIYVEPPVDDRVGPVDQESVYGFYWTEGKRGLGWVKDAVPTIKGGSSLGIPSPPAVWVPASGVFGTPSINDAERMFGFPVGWTEPAYAVSEREGVRWKLVGNTICVPMVDWVFRQIERPHGRAGESWPIPKGERLPRAAYSVGGVRFSVDVSTWITPERHPALGSFLNDPLKPLSLRAASGFHRRALESTSIRFADGFLEGLSSYISRIEGMGDLSRVSFTTAGALKEAA